MLFRWWSPGEIRTHNIEAAVAALRSGRCTSLLGNSARWGDAEAARLADALEAGGGGATLRELHLGGNQISDAGAARLAGGLEGDGAILENADHAPVGGRSVEREPSDL